MHVETYPAFLTPRDKKLSLSSSVENPSEFGWLEIKRTRKKNIYEKQSKCSVAIFLTYTKGCPLSPLLLLRTGSRELYIKKITKQNLRLFTHFPNLITKESSNWWVTRRIWGLRQQKSEEKYPKELVANIGKH